MGSVRRAKLPTTPSYVMDDFPYHRKKRPCFLLSRLPSKYNFVGERQRLINSRSMMMKYNSAKYSPPPCLVLKECICK